MDYVPSQAEDCVLPTPFTSFAFTAPSVRRRVPPDSVSTLPKVLRIKFWHKKGEIKDD